MAFILYTIPEATKRYNEETVSACRDETFRNRMKAAQLTIHKVGNLDLITEEDLNRLIHTSPPKRGRPPG